MVGWLAGWLVGWLVGSNGWLVWLVFLLGLLGWLVGFSCLLICFDDKLFGLLTGLVVALLVGWIGRLVGMVG